MIAPGPRLLRPPALPVLALLGLFLSDVTAAENRAEVLPARVTEIAGWLPANPVGFGKPASDRVFWQGLASVPGWSNIISEVGTLLERSMPPVTDELYLDFSKTGNRERCQKVLGERDRRVVILALAECLENRGRLIKPLSEAITNQCGEKTWVLPAHDRKLENFNGRIVDMDLRATLVGWELATIDYLLGDKLPATTRELLRREVRRRILNPYREIVEGRKTGAFWLSATHNWNSVCLAGVTGAALAMEPASVDRAWYVAVAELHIQNFLRGFAADGYCSEGLGYWNYGYGRFLMLSEAIRQATGGKLDLLTSPRAMAAGLFATRLEVWNGVYPSIADCHPGTRPDPQLLRFIVERYGVDLPSLKEADFRAPGRSLAPTLMFASLPEPLARVPGAKVEPDSPRRSWFPDGGVLICRPDPGSGSDFAAVLKGGHNAEHHNHNDVGSFSLVQGRHMVLCDPGSEIYTARTFSSKRYESRVLNSYGHSVPVLGGKLQQEGASARARVLKAEFGDAFDVLSLDIRSAYPVLGLKQMERTFTYHRGAEPRLMVRDDVAFESPQTYESALMTWGKWEKVSEHEVVITEGSDSVRVRIETGGIGFRVQSETLDEDVATRSKPVRIGIRLDEPVKSAQVVLLISPGLSATRVKR